MDGLLVELNRTPGSFLSITFEFAGERGMNGYPEDVVKTVEAGDQDLNSSLKITDSKMADFL